MKWLLLSVIVVLFFVTFFISPYSEAIDEAIKETSRIYAIEVAGIINLMQGAPDVTVYEHRLPDVNFVLRIDKSVNFTIVAGEEENSYVADFIHEPASVDEVCFFMNIDNPDPGCIASDGTMIFRRTMNEIRIS